MVKDEITYQNTYCNRRAWTKTVQKHYPFPFAASISEYELKFLRVASKKSGTFGWWLSLFYSFAAKSHLEYEVSIEL